MSGAGSDRRFPIQPPLTPWVEGVPPYSRERVKFQAPSRPCLGGGEVLCSCSPILVLTPWSQESLLLLNGCKSSGSPLSFFSHRDGGGDGASLLLGGDICPKIASKPHGFLCHHLRGQLGQHFTAGWGWKSRLSTLAFAHWVGGVIFFPTGYGYHRVLLV